MATQSLVIILFSAAVLSGVAACVYFLFRKENPALLVLVVEKIGVAPDSSHLKKEWVPLKSLEKTLEHLIKKNFSFISLADLKNKKKLPVKPVLLCFMGGYQTVYTQALPLLKKHNLKACLFLSPRFVDGYNECQSPDEEPWQNMLTAKQLKYLQTSKLFSFGAMGLNRKDLSLLPTEETLFELTESAFRLKKLFKLSIDGFAWNCGLKKHEEKLTNLCQKLEKLPFITFQKGINSPKERQILRSIHLGKNLTFAALQIFKQR